MATLYNPLDKFASYSIHHIMLLCRTTSEAEDFTNESKNRDTLAAIDQVRQLGEAVPYGSKDTAFLIMDTRRFAQFSIQNMKYDVFINGVEQTGEHGNLATNVTMTILDTVGISFINFLQWMMDEKMKTNFDGMIFMHRTVFVGHTPDGKSETVQTITIPMHLHNLELNLDYAKGAYTAEFMPNMNFNIEKHHRWLNISSASRYFTGEGQNTLGSMINSFEKQLNNASSEYYEKAQIALQKAGRSSGTQKYGRLVRYMITIPEQWESFVFTGAATAAATETIFKKSSGSKTSEAPKEGNPKDSHLSVEPGLAITEVLTIMFDQVKDIAALGAGKKTEGANGSVTFYKYFVGITSDDDLVIVHVDVVPFEIPNVVPTTGSGGGVDKFYTEVDGARVPKNYAEFDYIFTGNNKDILNFDMKMQNLTWLLASNLNLGPGAVGVEEHATGEPVKAEDKADKKAELVTARAYDALLLPRNTAAELDNFAKYTRLVEEGKEKDGIKDSQDYARNLSMFYAMSPVTAIMTIRGNPDIMAKFNQNSFLPHRNVMTSGVGGQNSLTNTEEKKKYRKDFEQSILTNNQHSDAGGNVVQELRLANGVFKVARTLGTDNYAQSPVFVKVNIKGPKVDFKTGSQIMDGEFAEQLLQNNFYTVFKLSNTIEGHVFTQELELYSHNIFGMGKMSGPEAKKI